MKNKMRLSFIASVILLAALVSCAPPPSTGTPAATLAGPAPVGDYGDAPDGGPTGYPALFAQTGSFPTLFASDGARVLNVGEASLGGTASAEVDANDPADPDGTQNLTNADSDDGLVDFFIALVAIPPPTTMTVNVSAPAGSAGGTFYLNALIDLNMDGVWGGPGVSSVLDWVVQNHLVQVVPGDTIQITPPPFAFANGNLLPDGAFMRLALTKEMVPNNWDGTGEFSSGEIEDHFIKLPEFPGKLQPPPVLSVDCNGPYRPGQVVTCTVMNLRPVAGTFTYALRHTGSGTVGVPIATCSTVPPGGPVPILANGVFVITCNSTAGRAPDSWRFVAKVLDPDAVVVEGGIRLGHSEESISDFEFEGNPKALNVFLGDFWGSYEHFSGYSMVNADLTVYGNDPIRMEGATVTMQMTHPDGSTETMSAVTGAAGSVRVEFEIFVFGNYVVEVVNIEGENMVYSPDLNVATSLEVVVVAGDSDPVGPVGIPDAPLSYDITSFIEAFNLAFFRGDIPTLLNMLHPAVFELYGVEACTSYIMEVVGRPIQVEVLNVISFGLWDWERDGIVTMLDNVYFLGISVDQAGETSLQGAHYGQLEDGTLSWFTDCGEPME